MAVAEGDRVGQRRRAIEQQIEDDRRLIDAARRRRAEREEKLLRAQASLRGARRFLRKVASSS